MEAPGSYLMPSRESFGSLGWSGVALGRGALPPPIKGATRRPLCGGAEVEPRRRSQEDDALTAMSGLCPGTALRQLDWAVDSRASRHRSFSPARFRGVRERAQATRAAAASAFGIVRRWARDPGRSPP